MAEGAPLCGRDGLPIGNLDVNVKGTVGGLIGATGSAEPTVDFVGTDVAGLQIGDVLTPFSATSPASFCPL